MSFVDLSQCYSATANGTINYGFNQTGIGKTCSLSVESNNDLPQRGRAVDKCLGYNEYLKSLTCCSDLGAPGEAPDQGEDHDGDDSPNLADDRFSVEHLKSPWGVGFHRNSILSKALQDSTPGGDSFAALRPLHRSVYIEDLIDWDTRGRRGNLIYRLSGAIERRGGQRKAKKLQVRVRLRGRGRASEGNSVADRGKCGLKDMASIVPLEYFASLKGRKFGRHSGTVAVSGVPDK
ncbi:hypothetical protein B0H16DRAFT_1451376 [Mycena metata]|uniref:Uncharacterized protein n=1 Tax=Mycena metata TaxID=1033252 RepID=A0AAD7JWV7_9AGAR|nr:hypothetical protein B0H16DRAFT_1451376 [Mycena metata]